MQRFVPLALAAVVLAAVACDGARPTEEATTASALAARVAPVASFDRGSTASQNQLLAGIRAATARYHDVDAAIADGYAQATPCVAEAEGGDGIHYVKQSLVDGVVTPLQPEVLLYEPKKNGGLKLVAAEYLVVARLWDPTHAGPPTLGTQPLDDERAPGSPGPPFPHYGLHAWVWAENPNGMYAEGNPKVSCDVG